ncbi:MAG TPA: alginate lyase family protein [Verrucomicrobiae bacterium]|jgi:hypothetical protein|nr:alginate lyase family protein [Verrucomicrobiae bacterium]
MKQFFSFAVWCVWFSLIPFISTAANSKTIGNATSLPRVFIMDAQQIQATRQRLRDGDTNLQPALKELERDAKKAMSAGPFSVVNKKDVPPSGDKHDYMSEAPYFWPNPDTTNGFPYIRRDGERNPARNSSDHQTLDELESSVETLSLAYYFTGKEDYAAKAVELLRVWFINPATRMNPNLEYGQSVPGVNSGRGSGLIETRGLTRVVDGIGLLEDSPALTERDRAEIKKWFTQFLKWMRESKIGRTEGKAKNNHGTYYDVQTSSFALFIGEKDLARNILRNDRDKCIPSQIEPDGRQPLELARTRSWTYSVMNLSGLMSLAALGENVKVDLWNYQTVDGRSIRKALDYLIGFSFEDKKWPDEQLGGVSRQSLYSLVRLAAHKFPHSHYAELLAKMPPVEPNSRANLLIPRAADPNLTPE